MDLLFPVICKTRKLVELIDGLKLAAAQEHSKLSSGKIQSHRERLRVELFVRSAVNEILKLQQELTEHQDGHVQELEAERAQLDASADLSIFYGLVKQLKEYHRRSPNEPADARWVEHEVQRLHDALDDDQLDLMFSGEESYGRFLDLNILYKEYVNCIVHKIDLDYLSYCRTFHDLSSISLDIKKQSAYPGYLTKVLCYLEDFIARALPLYFLDYDGVGDGGVAVRESVATTGWNEELTRINSITFEPDLFCSPCDHLFINRNSYESHLRGKAHQAKAAHVVGMESGKKRNSGQVRELFESMISEKKDKIVNLIQLETRIGYLARHVLSDCINATCANIERRQAMTAEELAAEDAREQERMRSNGAKGDDRAFLAEHMDGGVYNPLRLPLDWDGKPIPLWLWKLHGLGCRFPCEVCGNYVYLGRKAFDQHFSEWRHSHGMRCLGVPNTRHFFQITKIAEVMALWEELKQGGSGSAGASGLAAVEEVEDAAGNVYSRKVYEDMRRQGLI